MSNWRPGTRDEAGNGYRRPREAADQVQHGRSAVKDLYFPERRGVTPPGQADRGLAIIAHVFDTQIMMSSTTGHTCDQADERDQLTVARLTGAAQRHAPWREPTRQEMAAAVEELREIAGPRADLLAEVAGLLIGFYQGTAEQARARAAARYCRAAGADPELIPRWMAEGQHRAAYARQDARPAYLAS
jgi:hypothetical protein